MSEDHLPASLAYLHLAWSVGSQEIRTGVYNWDKCMTEVMTKAVKEAGSFLGPHEF